MNKKGLFLLPLFAVSLFGSIFATNKAKDNIEAAEASKSSYWSSWISNNSSALATGGTTLVTALKSKITQVADGSANTVSYDGLWTAYKTSDAVPGSNGNYIWDMYGGFQFAYQSGGKSYSKEGDCYNREHSVPKSWFSENKPAYSDLIHLVPTDGKVNGMRSNYTFGEVSSASYTYSFPARSYNSVQYQAAGSSKLGTPKTINGESAGVSTVFEPDDQYKGDFARIYMYFAVRYGGGTCQATSGDGGAIFTSTFTNANPYMTDYGLALMQKWHVQDPVSEKETNRNDAVESLQGNRNPFVDYPEWADKIFGTSYSSDPTISLSQSSASLAPSGSVTLTASTTGGSGSVTWTTSNSSVASLSSSTGTSVTVTAGSTGSATITATYSGVTATCTVTVANKTLSTIAVSTAPTKTTYTVDEYFDPTGLVIRRNYSDSTYDTYTYANHTSEFTFSPSTSTALTTEHTSVTITYSGKSTTQTITVNSSGGGGSGDATLYSGTLTEGDYVIVYSAKAMKNTISSNRLTYDEVTITNNTISSPDASIVWHIAPSGNYWTIYNSAVSKYAAGNGTKNQAQLLASGSNDSSLWTSSGTSTYEFVNKGNTASSVNANLRNNGTYGFACYSTNTGGELSLYQIQSGGSATLTSISVSTPPTKTSYIAGEYFDPTGLVITRNYSDSTSDTYTYAGHTSEFTFDPSTSTALSILNETVTITYGGQSTTIDIDVEPAPATSITASVSKTYYVGETISTSDITVRDNNDNVVAGFTFANDGYQFTYSDANSGGSATSKTFTSSITYNTLSCSLTVAVKRKARVTPSSATDTITASNLTATSTQYADFSNVAITSDARYAGNSAKTTGGAIQMRSNNSNSGIVSTTSGGTIKSVTITVESGSNTILVFGKNTAYSAATDLYDNSKKGTQVGSVSATGTVTFTTAYAYVGIRSNSGAIYLTNVAIAYGSSDSAENLSNYIMYTDTNNQCTTKFSVAKGYFEDLDSTERSTFMTSNDYVIATARERFQAWAKHEGKSINQSAGDYVIADAKNNVIGVINSNSNALIIVITITSITALAIGGYFFLRKKKE